MLGTLPVVFIYAPLRYTFKSTATAGLYEIGFCKKPDTFTYGEVIAIVSADTSTACPLLALQSSSVSNTVTVGVGATPKICSKLDSFISDNNVTFRTVSSLLAFTVFVQKPFVPQLSIIPSIFTTCMSASNAYNLPDVPVPNTSCVFSQ